MTHLISRSYLPFLPALTVQQSVKEVLDDLKGDGLLDFDKIGTSNCEWSAKTLGCLVKSGRDQTDRGDLLQSCLCRSCPIDFWSFPSAAGAIVSPRP